MKRETELIPAGKIRKFEPTASGRRQAAALVAKFPFSCQLVQKVPHHVEYIVDWESHPVTPEKLGLLRFHTADAQE